MQIGIFLPTVNPVVTPEYLAAFGAAAEERGFHSIWVPEHVVLFDDYESQYPYAADGRIPAGGEHGMFDPWTTLAFLAASTSTIRLGTGICLVPQRNPVYTAKEVATVDWLSNGRVDFGIGVGWLAEEFAALNMPFAERGERADEYIEVMRALWCDPVSEHHGRHYDLAPCRQYPKPVQHPHPPIHVGGESNRALRRVADLADGWYGFNQLPEHVPERLAHLDTLLAARGRSRDEITVSICPYLLPAAAGALERYHEAGVDQLILMVFALDVDGIRTTLDDLAKTMVEPARALLG
jgi:probable F420-dependent oxidoreductase